MRRLLFGVFAGLVAAVVPGTAYAQSYNEVLPGQVTLNVGQLVPGGSLTVSACCFVPSSTVTFTVFSDPIVLGTAIANAQGVATGTFTVPLALAAGTHHIEASGQHASGSTVTYSSGLVARSGSTATTGPLARTGSSNSTVPTAAAGAASVVIGAGLVAAAKRHRARTVTSD